MKATFGRGRWRWLLGSLVLAGALGFVGFSPDASGFRDDHEYTAEAVRVSAAAVVDVRALSKRPSPPEPASAPEPEERDEQATLPSRPTTPPSMPTFRATEPSPYFSAGFLAQTDAPLSGKKTESPPDTNGAVGREKLMSTLNSNYAIQRKSDGKLLSKVSMTAFWRPVGAHRPFDPRILFDPYSDRWLVSAADDPALPSSKILYGISESGDPEGRWRLYAIQADPTRTTFADFPTLGFTQSTVAIAINVFSNSSKLAYVRGRLIVLDYASLRSGGSGTPVDISVPGGFALQPAVTYSPTETNLYLVEHVDSMSATYRFWSLRGGTLTLVGGGIRTNPLGPWGTPGPGNVLPQQNGRGVDTGDSRASNVVFRSGHVYHAQAIALPPGGTGYGTHTAVQWVELDTTGAFVQGGRIEDNRALPWNGGHSYAFPSIAVNAREDVLVGFSEFESDDFIDAAYAFRAGTDPPGTMREPVTLKDGEGPYYKTRGGLNRWGDYSGAQVDPSDDLSLWTVQEYPRIPVGRGDGSGRWGTWWGRVGGGPPLTPTQCVVPNVVGEALRKAWRRVVARHCRLGKLTRVRAAKSGRGRVLRQSPPAGRQRPSDARVNLTVGR
jgi:hypothetical protein